MTCSDCGPEAEPAGEGLRPQHGADGSFSLFSARFSEGFHGPIGAVAEAHAKFVRPAQLERFAPASRLVVVDVGFGLGTNSAALLEAAQSRGLHLQLWGLELDPEPLRLALAAEPFRRQWQPSTLELLATLLERGAMEHHDGAQAGATKARLLWGDARQRLGELLSPSAAGGQGLAGCCDLLLLDAFSPQRCPELWSLEFLGGLTRLLKPEGRLLTYCCAAAVRCSLQRLGLELASIAGPPPAWSYGTAASPSPLHGDKEPEAVLRPLTPMELEHLATRAAEPYRDPSGRASAAAILTARQRAQAGSTAGSTSAWRRRWGSRVDSAQAAPPR
jgi:tRNA U34 5-methylaminomethyl-2-thiouridine-forming methyltransferase MnmC